MMGSPEDLEDFATGFSVSEGVIDISGGFRRTLISKQDDGITIDISLNAHDLHRYLARRRVRQLRGNTSCGLCGVEDLADIRRAASRVPHSEPVDVELIRSSLDMLRQWQPLSRQTRGAHASAWVTLEGQLSAVREDVGRHNSLDKLIGSLVRGGNRPQQGFGLITSRCSFEMVQKAVAAGFPTLVSAGAPTAHAVRLAIAAGLRLYSLSRDGEPLLFTSPGVSESDVWPELAS
jgi:FdhD protein